MFFCDQLTGSYQNSGRTAATVHATTLASCPRPSKGNRAVSRPCPPTELSHRGLYWLEISISYGSTDRTFVQPRSSCNIWFSYQDMPDHDLWGFLVTVMDSVWRDIVFLSASMSYVYRHTQSGQPLRRSWRCCSKQTRISWSCLIGLDCERTQCGGEEPVFIGVTFFILALRMLSFCVLPTRGGGDEGPRTSSPCEADFPVMTTSLWSRLVPLWNHCLNFFFKSTNFYNFHKKECLINDIKWYLYKWPNQPRVYGLCVKLLVRLDPLTLRVMTVI